MGLLIACDRRIVNATNDLRSGQWRKKEYGKARGLRGRTLGIVGVGMIGKEVASDVHTAWACTYVAWSRSLDAGSWRPSWESTYCAVRSKSRVAATPCRLHVAAARGNEPGW